MSGWWSKRDSKAARVSDWESRRRVNLDLGSKWQAVPIVKDAFFIIKPVITWNRIILSPKPPWFIFVVYFLSSVILVGIVEGHTLMLTGKSLVERGQNNRFTFAKVFVFEAWQFLFLAILLWVTALFLTMYANACHQRNNINQSLKVVLHSIGPLLLIQLLNGIPGIYVWLTWCGGVFFCLAAFYNGIPRILMPDAPSALGLFITAAFVFVSLLAVWRFMTYWYLIGEFRSLENFFTNLASNLPI